MTDKGYRQLENQVIGRVDKKRKPEPIVRKPVEGKPKTQVERY